MCTYFERDSLFEKVGHWGWGAGLSSLVFEVELVDGI